MPDTIFLNNGKSYTIFNEHDFFSMLQKELGDDAANYFSHTNSQTTTKATAIEQELHSYESSLESLNSVMCDAVEICDAIKSEYDAQRSHPMKYKTLTPIVQMVSKIKKLLNDNM